MSESEMMNDENLQEDERKQSKLALMMNSLVSTISNPSIQSQLKFKQCLYSPSTIIHPLSPSLLFPMIFPWQFILIFQILTAMSTDNRKHLSSINESLRAEHNNLKSTKDHLLEHIAGLMKREKQLNKLKNELIDQLARSEEQIKMEQRNKAPLCLFLKEELSQLDKRYIEDNLRLKNLENQYQVCLHDYEKVIETVNLLLESGSGTEGELSRLKENDITMKAMIFDCERLKRVLEEERRYFKELCNSEEKSHSQRLKELESIKKNLKEQEDTSTCSIRLSKLHIGLMKLGGFFDQRMNNYRETLIRGETKELRVVKLGVKTFQNFLNLSTIKMNENMRKMFRLWHNNAFPKYVLKDITERALQVHEESRIIIKTLGAMQEKTHRDNTNMLHLFEKLKYIVAIANKNYRKDKHYGFNIWRENCRTTKKISNVIENVFHKILPRHLVREYFKRWNIQARNFKRLQTASILLEQYQTTKDLARTFRKWRFQVLHHEERYVKEYIRRLQDQEKITKRLNYEKRKIKILTTLHFRLTKIKLRNYFTKYWCNVKEITSGEIYKNIQQERQRFSDLRKEAIKEKNSYKQKDRFLFLRIFRDFVYKAKIVPVYKEWRNQSQHFKKQKRALLSLTLRKQAKNKIYVMNEFRKVVQFYQKKEMHQVLTDLNKKMEAINEKSTQFRELLKNCIQNLGVIASKKIDYVTNYTMAYQQRDFFHTYVSQKIKKTYKTLLLARMMTICHISCQRQAFSVLVEHIKLNKKQKDNQRKVDKYLQDKRYSLLKSTFQYIKRVAKGHRMGFSMLIHIQNVFIFYRTAYAFAAIKRKYTAQKYKAMHKELQDEGNLLKSREENMINMQNTRKNAENALQQFFGKFIAFEDRKQKIKIRQRTHKILKTYLDKFRTKVKTEVLKQKSVENINDIFNNHNQFVFFRNVMIIRYEQLMAEVKQELSKINKKRKAFEEKNGKIRIDTQKRLEQEIKVYQQCKEYLAYYENRHEQLLKYYAKRTQQNNESYVKRQIFLMWKYETVATKRVFKAINRVYTRKFMKQPNDLLMNQLRNRQSKTKAQLLILDILDRKGERLYAKTLHLWKVNIFKMKLHQIQMRLEHLDEYQDDMKQQIKQRRELISNQCARVNFKKLKTTVFMAFKQVWQDVKSNKRKIKPMLDRRIEGYIKDAIVRWKWLIFYKHTKRSYLAYKKNKYQTELKNDVFNALKTYRQNIYKIVGRAKAANNIQVYKLLMWSFNKIRNEADNQNNTLYYLRRKALTTLLGTKISRIQTIKRKILWKWNAWLIPRTHYLPSILKRCELNTLKIAFANINEKKYWNDYYIKNIAEEVTSQGYNEINAVTNSLMREGSDPDEIKQYLKKRNEKDTKILDRTIKHFRTWARKQDVVRAFHSWKQYCFLKKNLKVALTKVFNIAGGIGKYWARWRAKDPHFNEILKKQSRGNMLNRYRELSRLLKEYHRDIRDNTVNLDELKAINNEYRDKNRMGILMALNTFSNSIKKGMRQGFGIWLDKVHEHRRVLMDERYDQMVQGLQLLTDQRSQIRYKIGVLREENKQLKEKCMWGVDCGKILERLLTEKDSLSIDLADKEHNLKLLLQDNLRLKQKVKLAKSHAQKLIKKVEEKEGQT